MSLANDRLEVVSIRQYNPPSGRRVTQVVAMMRYEDIRVRYLFSFMSGGGEGLICHLTDGTPTHNISIAHTPCTWARTVYALLTGTFNEDIEICPNCKGHSNYEYITPLLSDTYVYNALLSDTYDEDE